MKMSQKHEKNRKEHLHGSLESENGVWNKVEDEDGRLLACIQT